MTYSKRAIAGPRGLAANAARALAVSSVALALAGCYTTRDTTGSIPSDYRERHPIKIREGERTMEVFVGTSRGGLTPVQRTDVIAFAHAWRQEATGGVIVDFPTGTPNERAATDSLREIRGVLASAGVPPHGVSTRPYQLADKAAYPTIRLNYSKITAEAGPCGLWPHDLGPSSDPHYQTNKPYWNFGCANQRNLAAMVENPADLVQPRGDAPAYTGRRTTVLDKYRKGESTATVYPNETKGTISDVGK